MAERFYKSEEGKKARDECRIIDDRHEIFNIYKSKCGMCKHFQEWDYFCAAFPDGIPDEYLSADKVHDKIDKGQVGDTVFTEQT
jgi:hypothetical protein